MQCKRSGGLWALGVLGAAAVGFGAGCVGGLACGACGGGACTARGPRAVRAATHVAPGVGVGGEARACSASVAVGFVLWACRCVLETWLGGRLFDIL